MADPMVQLDSTSSVVSLGVVAGMPDGGWANVSRIPRLGY